VTGERPDGPAPRLEVLKALGDNTRYAIYLELARSPHPLSTAEVAATLGLHVNPVRPHLEKMRDVGLLQVELDGRGGVGRPQHLYGLAEDAPSLGLEPPVFPLATAMLLRMAASAGLGSEEALEAGRDQGRADASRVLAVPEGQRPPCFAALLRRLGDLGFDPAAVATEEGATIAFTHCPFRDLAEANPDLVCSLHRGLVEGFVASFDDEVRTRFRTLIDRDPCQMDLVIADEAGIS
jgi:predicted ArsR family transcriptional regulator